MNKRVNSQLDETRGLLVILGIMAVLLIGAFFARIQLPMIENDRTAFYALATLGFCMCAIGGVGAAVSTRGWKGPITILGSVLGIMAVALVLMGIAGAY